MDSLGVEWSSEFDVDSSLKEKGLLEVSICSAMTWLRCRLAVPLALSRSPTPCSQLLARGLRESSRPWPALLDQASEIQKNKSDSQQASHAVIRDRPLATLARALDWEVV